MENLKKLNKAELKTIRGGLIPRGCISWDFTVRCCRQWDPMFWENPVCPVPY
ncbi:bacteriocin-like protein [Chryseobacterium phosphatilyticum]|uniref:bacteriocin-like protein n=1 Tax=Chryseobacterium phosphatilyticum TaxID=475075 RepID=UPI0014022A6A|nr:hypothetical protein [Chryseobacterium phosphatilyticum]